MDTVNRELLSCKSSGMQSPVKFYVQVGSMALVLFVTGCANDTAIYSQPPANGQTGAPTAPIEEPAPPTTTEQTTTTTTTEQTIAEASPEAKMPPPVNPTQPKPWQPAPQTTGGTTTPAPVSYPKAVRVPGKANRVISPYAPYAGEVDVGGFAAGDQVKCPYTGKIFIVP
jgi:hypothetical protein